MERKRIPVMVAAWVVAALALAGCAAEGYRYGVSLDVSNAPPPPRVVFYDQPDYVAVLDGGVYVVDSGYDDYDMFRYGAYWYIYTGSYWYRARSYRGPYSVVRFESVPSRIYSVPDRHWKHHPHGGPPGQMKKRDRGRGGPWSS